jgi:hypothetical protein
MSVHLKTMESMSLVRTLITPEEMDEKVKDLSDYSMRETLVSYTGKTTPQVLAAWGLLLMALEDAHPDQIVAEGLSIYRVKSRAELEETVVQDLRSMRYWHPERYEDITQDMIEYGTQS